MSARPQKTTVGIGSMVVDRLHRVPRILGADEKGILRGSASGVREVRVGGVVLNHGDTFSTLLGSLLASPHWDLPADLDERRAELARRALLDRQLRSVGDAEIRLRDLRYSR